MRRRFIRSLGSAMAAVLFAVALIVGLGSTPAHAAGAPDSAADPWVLWQYDGGAANPLDCATTGINAVTDNQQDLWYASPEAAAQDAVAAYGGSLSSITNVSGSYPSNAATYEIDIANSSCLHEYPGYAGLPLSTPVFATDVVYVGSAPLGTVCPDDSYVPAGQSCPGSGGGGTGGGQGSSCSAQSPADCVAITSTTPPKPVTGQPITVNVTVSPGQGGSGTPTGSVVVSDGSHSCTAQLSGGSGSCQISEPAATTYTLTAAYGGDANFASSTSAGSSVHVFKAATVTGLALSVASVGYGSRVDEEIAVSVAPQFAGTPTGTVQVTVNGGYACYLLLIGGEAVCAFQTSELPPGTYSVKAAYYGDANFKSSKSPSVELVVSETTKTAISLSASTATYGSEQKERISVTVSPQVPSTVSGTVTITASGSPICEIHLSSNKGTCTLSKTALAAGSYSMIATYAGTSVYDESASHATTLTITP